MALSLAPVDASGWGSAGHEIGAAIAEKRLTPDARAMVREVAGDVPLSDPSIATWADAHRTPENGPWHYVNIPMTSGRYNPDRDCPTGSCAVAQIRRARDELAKGRDAGRRLEALRWIVHLVVDLHQPLHAGDGWDRGGNDLRVRLGTRKQPITLHSVWDEHVVEPLVLEGGSVAAGQQLDLGIDPADAREWGKTMSVAAWAEESNREAKAIYDSLRLTPQTRYIVALPRHYVEGERLRVESLLMRAGVRLAAMLNAIANERAVP